MMGQIASTPAVTAFGARAARVLVFTVDDGLFSVHLDFVEAVYPRAAVAVHAARSKGERPRPFVLHRHEPAPLVDLREAFDLEAAIGTATRSELLIVRSGSILLALPIDACVGVRDLDLRTHAPVPTALRRDGAVPVGHIVELDQKMLVVLDPNRLVDSAAREALVTVHRKGLLFQEREVKLNEIWNALARQPTAGNLRVYARLCSRNGRAKMAAAARAVLKCLSDGDALGTPAGSGEANVVLTAMIQAAQAERTGALLVHTGDATEPGRLTYVGGRVIDAACSGAHGRAAVKHVLAAPAPTTQFVDGEPTPAAERITESTIALALWALEALASERRTRRSR
jgi:chemotaxis signal transduction protein